MIQFWNGNKTAARQAHEFELVHALLPNQAINNDLTDYPDAADESAIFERGADVMVTVAGNPKFTDDQFIEVSPPICFGLLGCRLLITRKDDQRFAQPTVESFKQLIAGVPATWADATLLRDNHCRVYEHGDIEHILDSITSGQCDYLSLGANEIHAVFCQFSASYPQLEIHPTALLYYPLPLVFYVNPHKRKLAQQIAEALTVQSENGQLYQALLKHYGESIAASAIATRQVVRLTNPALNVQQISFENAFLKD